MDYLQQSFSGGMNLVLDDTRILDNQYREAFNVRNRFDTITQIKMPKKDESDVIAGKKQGIYTIGQYLVMFVAGKAYYRLSAEEEWTQIADFLMSPDVNMFYAVVVPSSSDNNNRVLVNVADISIVNKTDLSVNGTPGCMLVQDGINQPWLIFPNATARLANTYVQWTMLNREYVPIGNRMIFHNDILYVLLPDNKNIARSLTGRPLDFMVIIGTNGDKIASTEEAGGAIRASFPVGFDNITSIQSVNSDQLFVSSTTATKLVTPIRERPFYGEPRFSYTPLIGVGSVNQFSFVELLGDYGFIDSEGLRSFNAILNLKNEGRNSIFSSAISPALIGITQEEQNCSAVMFDNYAYFSVKSIYGYILVVYDTLNNSHVSFDQTDAIKIKQFAYTTPYQKKLFGITEDSLFELFGSEEDDPYPLSIVRTKSASSNDPEILTKAGLIRVVFSDIPISDNATVTLIVDGKRSGTIAKPMVKADSGVLYPVDYPVLFNGAKNVNSMLFNFPTSPQGFKAGAYIKWSNGATLTNVSIGGPDIALMNNTAEQSKVT